MLKGLFTAIITPFKDGKIDENAFARLIEDQIAGGVDGIVPCGTTGESPTLSHDEHNYLIELAVSVVNNRIKIIAGTGSNCTREAISLTQKAENHKVSAALIVAPYYNKPTKEGIYLHYKAINDNSNVPIIVYNVPSRTMVDISDEEIAKISKLQNIIGVKDATGDLSRVKKLKKMVDKDFSILSGEDPSMVEFNQLGGDGIISVTANIVPKLCSSMQRLSEAGDFNSAMRIQNDLLNLNKLLFANTNPIPVKYACYLAGICENEFRLPLSEPDIELQKSLKEELIKLNII
ncbi:MAG: 4-hydroxy-tetrahydrodipicolinate synthase [Rickettsiales bacterium]|jgi:4-hydroxy-tetrahydrodipicolinate synthase